MKRIISVYSFFLIISSLIFFSFFGLLFFISPVEVAALSCGACDVSSDCSCVSANYCCNNNTAICNLKWSSGSCLYDEGYQQNWCSMDAPGEIAHTDFCAYGCNPDTSNCNPPPAPTDTPVPTQVCTPYSQGAVCDTAWCSGGAVCGQGHYWCLWDGSGYGSCSEEINNCASQCTGGVITPTASPTPVSGGGPTPTTPPGCTNTALSISPNPAIVGQVMTFHYNSGQDTNIQNGTWTPSPGGVTGCYWDTNVYNRNFYCTANSAISNAVWTHIWNSGSCSKTAYYTIVSPTPTNTPTPTPTPTNTPTPTPTPYAQVNFYTPSLSPFTLVRNWIYNFVGYTHWTGSVNSNGAYYLVPATEGGSITSALLPMDTSPDQYIGVLLSLTTNYVLVGVTPVPAANFYSVTNPSSTFNRTSAGWPPTSWTTGGRTINFIIATPTPTSTPTPTPYFTVTFSDSATGLTLPPGSSSLPTYFCNQGWTCGGNTGFSQNISPCPAVAPNLTLPAYIATQNPLFGSATTTCNGVGVRFTRGLLGVTPVPAAGGGYQNVMNSTSNLFIYQASGDWYGWTNWNYTIPHSLNFVVDTTAPTPTPPPWMRVSGGDVHINK